jgi:hypothetical protein
LSGSYFMATHINGCASRKAQEKDDRNSKKT